MSPQTVKSLFYLGQFALGGACLIAFWWFSKSSSRSNFRDLGSSSFSGQKKAASDKPKEKQKLFLPGIRTQGAPHEILGISPNANSDQIQKAYRDLMKRYHPDKIGMPGSAQWQEAQKIAEAINRAREEMTKQAQASNPKRSGR